MECPNIPCVHISEADNAPYIRNSACPGPRNVKVGRTLSDRDGEEAAWTVPCGHCPHVPDAEISLHWEPVDAALHYVHVPGLPDGRRTETADPDGCPPKDGCCPQDACPLKDASPGGFRKAHCCRYVQAALFQASSQEESACRQKTASSRSAHRQFPISGMMMKMIGSWF